MARLWRCSWAGTLVSLLLGVPTAQAADPVAAYRSRAAGPAAVESRPAVRAASTRCAGCRTVRVPLDRSGSVSGSVDLRVLRLRAERPSGKALVYLSGGPGGAGILEFRAALGTRTIARLRRTYDLVGFDQRGTGGSGLLRCPALEHDVRLRSTAAASACAARLGPARAFYTTSDTVADLEDVRKAVGASKVLLYGVSYGTKVALAYARAHPDRVERLLLDSVVDPDESDAFGLEPFAAVARTLAALCPASCRGVSADPAADLAALVERLAAAPLAGRYGAAQSGRTVTAVALADLLFDADYAPALRAGVPAAVQGALRYGDPVPLLRLLDAAEPLSALPGPASFSSARYATVCEETPLPWAPGTPVGAPRLAEAQRRAAALGAGALRPFDFSVVRADEIDLCLGWPSTTARALPAGSGYPAVPALLLQGGEDLRTPPSASARVAAALGSSAARVVAGGIGHGVLASDPSGCAERALARWLRGGRPARRCPRLSAHVPPEPVLPARLADVEPVAGLPERIGRTVAALRLTMQDLSFALSPGVGLPARTHGLRGGTLAVSPSELALHALEVVPGVRVTGRATLTSDLRVRVHGPGAAGGRVSIALGGRMTGRLGGRRVAVRL